MKPTIKDNLPPRFYIPNGVIDSRLLDKNEKLVYIAIRRFLNNKTEVAFPSNRTLAKVTGLSVNTVRAARDGLEDKGIIAVKHNKINGENQVDEYRFCDTVETWEASTIEEMRAAAYIKPVTVEEKREQAKKLLLEVGFTQEAIDAFYNEHNEKDTEEKIEIIDRRKKGRKKELPVVGGLAESSNDMLDKSSSTSDDSMAASHMQDEGCKKNSEICTKNILEVSLNITSSEKASEKNCEACTNGDQDGPLSDLVEKALSDLAKKPKWQEAAQKATQADKDEAIKRFIQRRDDPTMEPIKSPRGYMRTLLEEVLSGKPGPYSGYPGRTSGAAGAPAVRKSPAGNFANFTQREYDDKELEARLLLAQE